MRKGPEKFKLSDILQNTWPKFLKKKKKINVMKVKNKNKNKNPRIEPI
jgi:hypothetical protein